jgi:hypothetical protein
MHTLQTAEQPHTHSRPENDNTTETCTMPSLPILFTKFGTVEEQEVR